MGLFELSITKRIAIDMVLKEIIFEIPSIESI